MKPGIFIPPDLKPYPKNHEILSARALAKAGYSIIFLQPDNRKGVKTPDILLNDVPYEIKAPTGGLKSIERSLKRASRQSSCVVFDCRRMKIKDSRAVQEELVRRLRRHEVIKSLLLINRYGNVIDLNEHC